MERTIKIEGQDITLKCTGNTPRVYRNEFTRDLFADLDAMNQGYQKNKEKADFSCIERLTYTMAKQANPDIGTIDEFLDQFGPFSLLMAMPDILDVWNESQRITVQQKKANAQ